MTSILPAGESTLGYKAQSDSKVSSVCFVLPVFFKAPGSDFVASGPVLVSESDSPFSALIHLYLFRLMPCWEEAN